MVSSGRELPQRGDCRCAEHRLHKEACMTQIFGTCAHRESSNVLEMGIEAAYQFFTFLVSSAGRFVSGILAAKQPENL
jgi:hypothetical protein